MNTERAIARWSEMLQRAIALPLLAAGLSLSGCRGTEGPGEQPGAPPFALTAGDRMIYDGWMLDGLGFTIDSTRTQRTWEVLSTTASAGGYSDVTAIREQILLVSNNTATADTFFLRLTPVGSVLRYGFLADLVQRREDRIIPRNWDTLSVPDESSWTVGTLDSTGQITESATAPGNEDYFNVLMDGVSSIFAARRIEMDSDRLQIFLWISTSPPCFPRLEEEPDPLNDINTGSLLLLREFRHANNRPTSSGLATGAPDIRSSMPRIPPGP